MRNKLPDTWGFEYAEEARKIAFKNRTPKQRLQWLEEAWELKRLARKIKRNRKLK